MFKVYIVDDELIVRQGLKDIIDWQKAGFEICGEAGDGLTALKEITENCPDLVLVDIRIPKLSGLDLVHKLRSEEFAGRIIVLSGYSEFEYAQEAIACNVDYYLTKPIAQDELQSAVEVISSKLQEIKIQSRDKIYYREKAKFKILEEMIKKRNPSMQISDSTLKDLSLKAEKYQVLILEKLYFDNDVYADFCEELQISAEDDNLERYTEEQSEILLLKGTEIISKFSEYQKNHALKENMSFVIMVGKIVRDFTELYASYQEAEMVRYRKFFSKEKKFIFGKSDISELPKFSETLPLEASSVMGRSLYEHIIVYKQHECERVLNELFEDLIKTSSDVKTIKSFLAGILIYIIQEFKKDYAGSDLSFKTSAEIIKIIESDTYLFNILELILKESKRMIDSISNFSSDGILEAVISYINHHYNEDIKLKTLADKFGYNSSYLGKIFNQKFEVSFNDYLHKVRTEKAMELLLGENYKIYEVADMVGYANVDYFHIKFREHVGTTPAKYRELNS